MSIALLYPSPRRVHSGSPAESRESLQSTGESGVPGDPDLSSKDIAADRELLQVSLVDVIQGSLYGAVGANVVLATTQDADQGAGRVVSGCEVVRALGLHRGISGEDLRQPGTPTSPQFPLGVTKWAQIRRLQGFPRLAVKEVAEAGDLLTPLRPVRSFGPLLGEFRPVGDHLVQGVDGEHSKVCGQLRH